MDTFEKFLRSVDKKMRLRILQTVSSILNAETQHLDIRPLKGYPKYFRCRIGNVRIIYRKENKKYFLEDAGFRSDIYKRWK